MKLRLVVVDPTQEGALLAEGSFDGTSIPFGRRQEGNELVIPDPAKRVSGRHGCFEYRGGGWCVRDLGSLNGTLLRGERVPDDDAGVPVRHGDILVIGGLEMQVLEDVTSTPSAGAEATRHHVDLADRSVVLGGELEALWARHRDDPDRRAAAIDRSLRQAVGDLLPEQGRSLLLRLARRWGGGRTDEPGDDGQEALYRAGLESLADLSRTLVAEERFTGAAQVGRFVVLLRQCLELTGEWIARNLAAREAFEEQFGAEVTMVFQRSANPIKKEDDAAAVLRFLLDWRQDRPPGNVRSYLEGIFEDLSEHQMGLLAGVQEAVRAVVERLDPERIEALAAQQGWGLASRASRSWEAYRKLYSDLLEEHSRLLQEVVSPAIRRGYLGSHDAAATESPPPERPAD